MFESPTSVKHDNWAIVMIDVSDGKDEIDETGENDLLTPHEIPD